MTPMSRHHHPDQGCRDKVLEIIRITLGTCTRLHGCKDYRLIRIRFPCINRNSRAFNPGHRGELQENFEDD